MAAGDVDLNCGSCKLKVITRSKVLRCAGKCGKPFHIMCINVSDSDYNNYKRISDIILWFCEDCKVWLDTVKTTLLVKQDEEVRKLEIRDKPICCDCFSYIKILTDEISGLSTNYKTLSDNMITFESEQIKLRTVLDSHTNIISEVVLSKDEENYKSTNKTALRNSNTSMVQLQTKVQPAIDADMFEASEEEDDIDTTNLGSQAVIDTDTIGTNSAVLTNDTTITPNPNTRPSYADVTAFQHPSLVCTNKNGYGPTETKFQEVKSKRQKRPKKSHCDQSRPTRKTPPVVVRNSNSPITAGKRQKFITGRSSEQDNLQCADKKVFLFVSRLRPSTKCEDLSIYLKNRTHEELSVEELKPKYPDLYSSFKVGLPSHLLNEVYSADFWPKNVFVSKFMTKRHPNNLNLMTKQTIEGT